MWIRPAAWIVLLIALLTPVVRADIVTLKDGRVIEGVITDETGGAITIDTLVANIRTSEEIPRFRIKSIERKPVPDDFFAPKRRERDDTDPAARQSPGSTHPMRPNAQATGVKQTMYLAIPVRGKIGESVTASGIKDAIKQAERRRIEHIVFLVDSPGGLVYEARQILDVLGESDESIEYHTFITGGAISAATVFAAAADHLYVKPDAQLGGAVSYTRDNSTGSVKVDAKMNSIWASELAARAESKGHSGDAYRAMVVMDSELWISESGSLRSAKISPADTQIDSKKTVATLTASQIEAASMGVRIVSPEEIGRLREISGWLEQPRVGNLIARTAEKRRQRLIDRHAELHRQLEIAADTAVDADPNSGRYYVDYDTGRFTGGSMAQWQQACDAAVGRWGEVRSVLLAMAAFDDDARQDGALHLIADEDWGNEWFGRVEEHLRWLSQHRNATSPP